LMRLPDFWANSPWQWYVKAEAVFSINRVRSDLSRVNHILTALNEDQFRVVADLLGLTTSYDTVRAHLIKSHTTSQSTRLRIALANGLDQRFPNFFFCGAFFRTQFSHGCSAVNKMKDRTK
jgi:hypothetical protein